MVRIIQEAWVGNPQHPWLPPQPPGQHQRVVLLPLQPQGQRLESPQHQPGILRTQRRPHGVLQEAHALALSGMGKGGGLVNRGADRSHPGVRGAPGLGQTCIDMGRIGDRTRRIHSASG